MSIPNTAFSASSQPGVSSRPVAATQRDAQLSRQAAPVAAAATEQARQQGSQILTVDGVQYQDQRQQRQQQQRDAVVAAVAASAAAAASQEKSPVKAHARPSDVTSGVMADLEQAMSLHVQECRHTYKDAVLFGRRCQALSKVLLRWSLHYGNVTHVFPRYAFTTAKTLFSTRSPSRGACHAASCRIPN